MDDISVIVVAESEIRRAGLSTLVKEYDKVKLVGAFGVAETIRQIGSILIEGLIVDWDETDSTEYGSLALEIHPDCSIVLLTDHIPDEFPFPEKQVKAILPKNVDGRDLQLSLEAIETELILIHPVFLRTNFLKSVFNRTSNSTLSARLTKRELEVLEWLALGSTNKEIADQLGISEHTIKFHVNSIFSKLNVSGRTEAVSQALRLGLLML